MISGAHRLRPIRYGMEDGHPELVECYEQALH